MNDEKQIVLKIPNEPFAKTPEPNNNLAVGVIDWWIEGAD